MTNLIKSITYSVVVFSIKIHLYNQGENERKDYLSIGLIIARVTTPITNPFEIQDTEIVVALATFSPILHRFPMS